MAVIVVVLMIESLPARRAAAIGDEPRFVLRVLLIRVA
jgi:hypothetical protein